MSDTTPQRPLEDRVAIVTGGTRGIGRAIAERLLRDGAKVWITARSADTVLETTRQLAAAYGEGRVGGVAADVGLEDDVEAMLESCSDAFGGLDIAVANAGIDHGRPFLDIDLHDWVACSRRISAGPS